jgi:Gene product 88
MISMPLLIRGNKKLGRDIYAWNLPVLTTCPGASSACSACCYATKGHFRWPSSRQRYRENLLASLRPDFPRVMAEELRLRGAKIVRPHSSGDYYSAEYVGKWGEIAERSPQVTFFSYTRSWRVETILPSLAALAALDNFHLWFSLDSTTGPAPRLEGVRYCWLQVEDERPPEDCGVELIFRTRRNGRQPTTRVGPALMCPAYNGLHAEKGVACESCKFCFARR